MRFYQRWRRKLAEIHPLLDKESQNKARQYEKEKRFLGIANMILSLSILLVFYFSGLSTRLAFLEVGQTFSGTFLVYVGVFYGTMTIFGLPLAFFSGFIHEHRWNFSNHTVKTWIWEQIKSFVVGMLLAVFLMGLLLWIMTIIPEWWWLVSAGAVALVSVIFAILFPVVIAPLFNKYTPIENEELAAALDDILASGGLKSSGLFKEDMSRQTKKENAFLAGLGQTRRVVLGDNLMERMTIPEIQSIIAHEVGHFKHRHIWKNIGIGFLQQLLAFLIVHSLLTRGFPWFLASPRWNLSLFPVLAILLGGVSGLLFAPLNNAISRKFEKQADTFVLTNLGDRRPFITALAGLANRNLANAYPQGWVKMLYYSHPPIGERLELAEAYSRQTPKRYNFPSPGG